MQENIDNNISGFIYENIDMISTEFTQISEIPSESYCRLVKAKRYNRWVLLKGLKPEYKDDVVYQQLLRKEFEIHAKMNHLGIVNVYGAEINNTNPEINMSRFIVMEWIDGVTLDEWLETKPSVEKRRTIFNYILDTVSYIHKNNVVHRDLKPKNIMITRNGDVVKIIDFGLADSDSHTILKQPAGTAQYMSPEQFNMTVTDCRNDIYSLGVILKQMKLGLMYQRVIKKCLSNIDNRYTSVDNLIEDINKKRKLYTINNYLQVALVVLLVYVAGEHFYRNYYNTTVDRPNGEYVIERHDYMYTSWFTGSNCVSAQCVKKDIVVTTVPNTITEHGNQWDVTELGFGAFHNCEKLEKVTIEINDGFEIQKDSFKGCKSLKAIYMPTIITPPAIGGGGWKTVIDSVFEPYHFEKVTIYCPNPAVLRNDSIWSRFKHIEKCKI